MTTRCSDCGARTRGYTGRCRTCRKRRRAELKKRYGKDFKFPAVGK